MSEADPLCALVRELFRTPADAGIDHLTMENTESWDSLKHMELVAGIETTYGIELTFEEITTLRSVAAIRKVLDQKGRPA